MSNLDLMKKRLQYLGGNAEERMIKGKLNSLEKSFSISYQSADILFAGKVCKSLINPNRLTIDQDDKIVSTVFETGLAVGSVFTWISTNTKWLVYDKRLTEDAYFIGNIRKCNNQIKWLDEKNIEREIDVSIVDPNEGSVDSAAKPSFSIDIPNNSLKILMPSNNFTKIFKRYFKFMLDGQVWEVVSSSDKSNPGITSLIVVESFINKEKDSSEIVGEIVKKEYLLQSTLDTDIYIDKPFELWSKLYLGNEVVSTTGTFKIITGSAAIVDGVLTASTTDPLVIEYSSVDFEYVKIYSITPKIYVNDLKILVIKGKFEVTPYGKSAYEIQKFVNGEEVVPTGSWTLDSRVGIVHSSTPTAIEIEWTKTKSDKTILKYIDGDTETQEIITVKSLF